MRRLFWLDRLLLVFLLPAWLVCFGLAVRSGVLEPTVWSSIFVETEANAYPAIVMFAPMVDVAGPRIGDRLIRVGEADQRNTNAFRLFADVAEAAYSAPDGLAEIEYERGGVRRVGQIPGVPLRMLAPALPLSPVFMLAGVAILLRAPRSRMARAVFHADR